MTTETIRSLGLSGTCILLSNYFLKMCHVSVFCSTVNNSTVVEYFCSWFEAEGKKTVCGVG